MPLHIIKLCVGVSDVETLERNAAHSDWRIVHTRMTPKRAAEIGDGGSLYWVIKGNVQCRQLITEIRPFTDGEGIGRCQLMLDPEVVRTEWQPRRAFQGWRYLKQTDAPADRGKGRAGLAEMPPKLRQELAELGLL